MILKCVMGFETQITKCLIFFLCQRQPFRTDIALQLRVMLVRAGLA